MSVELKKTARILIKLLGTPAPDIVKEGFNNMSKRDAEQLLELLMAWDRCAERVVQAYANEVRRRAKNLGVKLLDHSVSCRKKRGWCFTCLSNLYGSRFKTHGLYWRMQTNSNGDRKDWENVRKARLYDLLRQIGFTEEDINDCEYAVEMRTHIRRLLNYVMVTLKHVGLIDEDGISRIVEEKSSVGGKW